MTTVFTQWLSEAKSRELPLRPSYPVSPRESCSLLGTLGSQELPEEPIGVVLGTAEMAAADSLGGGTFPSLGVGVNGYHHLNVQSGKSYQKFSMNIVI